MTVAIYRDFDSVPEGISAFVNDAASRCFFYGFPWLRVQIETTSDPGDEFRLYAAEKAGRPVAVLAMRLRGAPQGRLGLRTLESCSSMYTTFYGPVLDPRDGEDGLREIARAIAGERPAVDVARLDSLDHDSPAFAALESALRASGFLTQSYFHFGNWYEDIAGTLEAYLMRRSSQQRYQIRQRTRKLMKARGRFELVTYAADVERAMGVYETVYARSWKTSEPYPAFTPALARAAAESGVLRMGLLFVDEEPAAAQIWIVGGGAATIFKVAFDEKFAKLAVATVLTHEMLRHVIEVDKVREIDHGHGDDAYKQRWVDRRRERWGLIAFNRRTAKGLAAAAWNFGGRAAKKLVQRFLRRSAASEATSVEAPDEKPEDGGSEKD